MTMNTACPKTAPLFSEVLLPIKWAFPTCFTYLFIGSAPPTPTPGQLLSVSVSLAAPFTCSPVASLQPWLPGPLPKLSKLTLALKSYHVSQSDTHVHVMKTNLPEIAVSACRWSCLQDNDLSKTPSRFEKLSRVCVTFPACQLQSSGQSWLVWMSSSLIVQLQEYGANTWLVSFSGISIPIHSKPDINTGRIQAYTASVHIQFFNLP